MGSGFRSIHIYKIIACDIIRKMKQNKNKQNEFKSEMRKH